MGIPPAYLFVVRHGNRLDAADKRWHLSSPTPYDPPLTYGGYQQARLVGNQIARLLDQARAEGTIPSRAPTSSKRTKFRVVIHSSPFLRCVQTSIAISAGLAQPISDSSRPSDLLVQAPPNGHDTEHFKSAVLRLDSFLGEWLSPTYFDHITPPLKSSLMLGVAKAELLKREDYSRYINNTHNHTGSAGSLWNSPTTPRPSQPISSRLSDGPGPFTTTGLASALPQDSSTPKSYSPPRPTYAVSSAGKIPEGFVTHAKDQCVTFDYQWESMREPLDFGDGGELGEEWASMHKRFRGGIRKMVNWYWNTEHPERLVSSWATNSQADDLAADDEDDVQTVVVIVSHGAGCNALIGALTHQPALMDVGIASITMASRKREISPRQPNSADPASSPVLHTDQIYDMRLAASTDHLQSNSSTPVSARSSSIANINTGTRGRTSTLGEASGPVMGAFSYSESFVASGSRSTSASASVGMPVRRESNPSRQARSSALSSIGYGAIAGNGTPVAGSPSGTGLWSPTPSLLRNVDDVGADEERDAFGDMVPNFDQNRFSSVRNARDSDSGQSGTTQSAHRDEDEVSPRTEPRGPMFSGPIKLQTNLESDTPAEEVGRVTQLGDGLGGLWGMPPPPEDAELHRDLSHAKRRWTVNEMS